MLQKIGREIANWWRERRIRKVSVSQATFIIFLLLACMVGGYLW